MPVELTRKLSLEEREGRAVWFPVCILRYFFWLWQIWNECEPALGPWEVLKLASKHFHQWVWGRVTYGALYLPRDRLKREGENVRQK